jgi:hypothetical protein
MMSSSQWCSLAFVAVLAGCQTSAGNQASNGASNASPAAIASAGAAARGDIVPKGGDISIGPGWYAYETYKGRSFRWVDNDATFFVNSRGPLAKVAVRIEPGPGLRSSAFTLDVVGQDGKLIAQAPVRGQQSIRFDLPAQAGKNAYTLHVAGGGKKIATDPRILNFRVFAIADAAGATIGAGHPDIVSGAGLRLGANWYPLEQYAGETFRWVNNDAQIIVSSDTARDRRLKLVAAAGPSIQSPANFLIALNDADGHLIQAGKIKARGFVYFNLPLKAGTNTFTLHVNSTGKRAPNDPRVLDFRVFSLAMQ